MRTDSARGTKPPWAKPPVSPRGRLAALVVAACLVPTGAAFLWASYDELTCPFSASVCDVTVSFGFFISLLALLAVGGGIAVWWRVRGLPVADNGTEGWVRVEAGLPLLAAAAAALTVPSRVCPPGYLVYRSFQLCIGVTDPSRRIPASSHVWLEWVVFGAGALVALVVAKQRRFPPWIAAILASGAWGGAMTYVLAKTVFPRTY